MIKLLRRIGIVRLRANGRIRWPIHISPWWVWVALWRSGELFGVFRNRSGVIRFVPNEPGRWLPRRWGFYILGIDIGDRG